MTIDKDAPIQALVNKATLIKVLSRYGLSLEKMQITPIGNGLINSTFLVSPKSTDLTKNTNQLNILTNNGLWANKSYVLQKLNHHVFTNPQQVTDNADKISLHLQEKVATNHYRYYLLSQQKNLTGKTLTHIIESDNTSNYWRILNYIENSHAVETLTSTEQAQLVGNAFGEFSQALSDLSMIGFHEVIKDFHNINHRLAQLEQAIETSNIERKAKSTPLIEAYKQQHDFIQSLNIFYSQLPIRLTHNDTKINNLLFDNNSKRPLAVVDLDTCMPGHIMNDFGDMIRTCCVNRDENHENTADITFDLEIFRALAEGYIHPLKGTLTPLERESLVIGTLVQPLMLSIRFLTDYLAGDIYFAVNHAEHNLRRASNQLHLFNVINDLRHKLVETVKNIE